MHFNEWIQSQEEWNVRSKRKLDKFINVLFLFASIFTLILFLYSIVVFPICETTNHFESLKFHFFGRNVVHLFLVF